MSDVRPGRPTFATVADVRSDIDARGVLMAGALGAGVGGRPAHYGGRPVGRRRRANGTAASGDTLSSCFIYLIRCISIYIINKS